MNTHAQTVVVTGAAQGLGADIARTLHAGGWQVVIADIDVVAAQTLAATLDPSGTATLALALDAARKPAFEQVLESALARYGSVQALVNNAALTRTTPVMEITPEEFDEVIGVNLRGCFFGCQIFGQHFRQQGYGRIVNMGSLAGQNGGTATGAHYAASKGGIATLTKVFARELAASGVTVNSVAPGPLDLPSVRRIVPAEKLAGMVRNIPVGTLGDAGFIAQVVAQLLSPQASFATGATWDVNGGLYPR